MTADPLQISLRDPTVYDELSADGINPRPHWAGLIKSLQELGSEDFAKRWARAERRIRENGVTYNIYGDPLGANRPWQLDLIPLLIPAEEWRQIEVGIIQRARLLEAVLADLYGPQTLLTQGHLPPELVFANPAFLRPLEGVRVPNHTYLHLVAIDIARASDGRWWVLADRTQAPSGAGYCLENRIIVADALPELFRSSNVLRLAPFFRAERDALISMADCDNPRVALLTPGPLNETYFDHSYLARYLGFSLVEGTDLTVRDRRVYLKTVEGLEPVDVILRRVDDDFCDPLELRGDSFLGVTGLVDAVVAGNVRVANALGTGLIETAALMPFLPGLARHLLGQHLALPSVATWWCGQDYALKWVLDHLSEVVIKPAFPSRGMEPVLGAELAKTEKRLRAQPYAYIAQEQVALSTAPVWDSGRLSSRSVVLRTYALNTGKDWIVMPGGLVRVAGDGGSVVSMQRGGNSKDGWVLSDGPVDTFTTLQPRFELIELRRGSADLPSRVANNLFWLARYAERAENIARVLRTLVNRVRRADESDLGYLLRLRSCLRSGHSTLPTNRQPTNAELETELISMMTDANREGSLASTLAQIGQYGRAVRERLSSDLTRLIGELTESIQVEEYMLLAEYPAVLTGCLELLWAFSGLERENTTRGSGWLFISLGTRLERAISLARQLQELTEPLGPSDFPLLECLLEIADSSITYRSRYYTVLHPVAMLDLLMMDDTNPRSLNFQLRQIADLYAKLPRHIPNDLRAMTKALALLRNFNLQNLEYPSLGASTLECNSEPRERLKRSLREVEESLPAWSNNLSNTYVSHAGTLPITIGE